MDRGVGEVLGGREQLRICDGERFHMCGGQEVGRWR